MKTGWNAKKLIKELRDTTSADIDERTVKDILGAMQQSAKQEPHSAQPNFWKYIMESRLTRLAAAAVVLIGFGVAARIFLRPAGRSAVGQGQESVYAEMIKIRQMAASGDVAGLASILAEGRFESKLVAANFLAKMGDLPALQALSMHAAGNLIIEGKEGRLLLRSAKGADWLEVDGSTLLVHTDESIQAATKIRITHDIEGDSEDWQKRQTEFRRLREERVDLEEKLAQPIPDIPEDANQLRARLAKINELLDGIDGAVYVTVDSGRLELHSPFHGRRAYAELSDGIVRVEAHGNVVEANSVTMLHGQLRPVRTDGPPLPTPGWRERFDRLYSLNDGEVLRWVRAPFIPERQIYATQELHYYSSTNNPPPPGYLFFRWDGKLYWWALAMHECSLGSVLMSIGLERYEYNDEPQKLSPLKLGGDWIERKNAPMEDKLSALEKILEHGLGRKIRFEKRKVNRDAIIVRGQYKHVPLEGVEHPDNIYVYPDSWKDFSGPEPIAGGGTCSVAKMTEMVGGAFDRPVVFETDNLSDITVGYFNSVSYDLAIANVKSAEEKQAILDSVLRNLTRQTSLQFEYGQCEKDIWFITEQNQTE
ncbi:MAG TPA: hypothetical protein VMW16_01645 [Sedimentisphaerales bacterium]|nr:hypothetical protein [Sedimentisphaerales bacterium]